MKTLDGHELHWEHGYRCHGLWTQDGRRCGIVGIGPRGVWEPRDGYYWSLDGPTREGTEPTLQKAKRQVERLVTRARLRADGGRPGTAYVEIVCDVDPRKPTKPARNDPGAITGVATPMDAPSLDGPVDALIGELESRGLGWSLDHTGGLIEARVWNWPDVVGRYRPDGVEPLARMLARSMAEVDWKRYPVRKRE